MPLPSAAVMHDTPGRLRLRIAERRGDRAYFDSTQRILASCPGIRHVSASALTGSIVVVHGTELSTLAAFAREHAVFELAGAPLPETFQNIQGEMRRLDEKLRGGSNQRWGAAGLTFYGLVGAGLWQLTRGRVLPPTVTLLFQALNVFKQALEAEQATRSRLQRS